MTPSHSKILTAFIAAVVVALWVTSFALTEVFRTHKSNEPHRTRLLQIQKTIEIGASHADVLAAYWQHRTAFLALSPGSRTNWVISMPREWLAGDWRLFIEFHDGKVAATQIRTADGSPPKDGPPDKRQNTE
jgi:hypothetical protein